MNSKGFARTVAIVLAAVLVVGIVAMALSATAGAVTQSEIDALQSQRDTIRSQQSDIQEQIDSLQTEMTSVIERKEALDQQNELNRQDIELINQQIELYDEMIQEKADELTAAIAAEEEQYERYCSRVRTMEENGTWSYISFIFKAESLSDFLARLNDVIDIMQYDKDVEAEYIAAREHVELVKAEYETVQAEQREKRVELLAEKQKLEQQIEDACLLIAQLEEDIDEYTSAYLENEALESEVQAKIDQKVAELEAQEAAAEALRKQQELLQNSTGGTGSTGGTNASVSSNYYYWPSQSCTYITSRFGYRVHPIFQTTKYHAGVDIAASAGSTISAAAAGTVSIAEYSSSYGNYVVIYHSNGTTTLYAHMSSMAVSAGDSVSQGQTIGYVGSTGWSTGPHLHFEIRVNGSCVDPLSYFPGISFTYASDA